MSKASDLIRQTNIGMVGGVVDKSEVPPNIIYKYDLQYGDDSEWNVFNIYYEKSNEEKHPTLISIHGGAWVSNTKESYKKYCLDLAARGFNVINFTFRLAPENKHPAMIEDVNQMVKHLVITSCGYIPGTKLMTDDQEKKVNIHLLGDVERVENLKKVIWNAYNLAFSF